jgi:hypothetical protein
MRLYDGGVIIIIVAAIAIIGMVSSRWLGDDNPIEEVAEDLVESQTGLALDFTPDSSEN